MDYRINLAHRLKALREEAGYTQQILADYLEIDKSTYAHYESGRRSPDVERLCRLAAYYNLTDELLGVKKEKDPLRKDKPLYYRFPIVVPEYKNSSPQYDLGRVYPLKQNVVHKVHNYLMEDNRVQSCILFGSSITNRCHQNSDLDFMIQLKQKEDLEHDKLEVSERVQELCDWNADILWRDRILGEDRITKDILLGVRIA